MEHLLLAVIAILLVSLLVLWTKVCFLRRGAREIAQGLQEHLAADTNTLIGISSHDPEMRRLAAALNGQLRQLRAERLRYQQGDQELKTAVTNISHDLRTPLTAICGYLELLEREEQSENARRYLAQIENRTQALKDLTEELLRYSIVVSGQELKREQVDLVAALETSLLSFYPALAGRGIVPELTLPEGPVYRSLDPGAVSRVFSNIFSNALKYADGAVSVSMSGGGRITFSNPAPGLDVVTVGRLFDRFFTVEARRNATGLGLSIARALTEQMGGRIGADYQAGVLSITVDFGPA